MLLDYPTTGFGGWSQFPVDFTSQRQKPKGLFFSKFPTLSKKKKRGLIILIDFQIYGQGNTIVIVVIC